MKYIQPLVLALLVAAMLLLGASLCGAQQQTTSVPDMSLPLLKGLQHFWKGVPGRTGGLTLYDLVPGSLDHGTFTNMGFSSTSGWGPALRPGGRGGWQVNFDGVDDYVQTPLPADITVTTPLTLCLWVFSTAAATGGGQRVLLRNTTLNTYTGIVFNWADNNLTSQAQRPALSIVSNGGLQVSIRVTADRPLSVWEHLCATYDGSQTPAGMALWANGTLLPTFVESNTGFGPFTNNPWRIGASNNTPIADFFTGAMDSVMVFTRALSLADIQALYQASLQGDAGLFVSPFQVLAAPAGSPGAFFPFFK